MPGLSPATPHPRLAEDVLADYTSLTSGASEMALRGLPFLVTWLKLRQQLPGQHFCLGGAKGPHANHKMDFVV